MKQTTKTIVGNQESVGSPITSDNKQITEIYEKGGNFAYKTKDGTESQVKGVTAELEQNITQNANDIADVKENYVKFEKIFQGGFNKEEIDRHTPKPLLALIPTNKSHIFKIDMTVTSVNNSPPAKIIEPFDVFYDTDAQYIFRKKDIEFKFNALSGALDSKVIERDVTAEFNKNSDGNLNEIFISQAIANQYINKPTSATQPNYSVDFTALKSVYITIYKVL